MNGILSLCKKIISSDAHWSVSLLRAVLGFIFFKEGAGKLFGWFGGGGWAATCAYFDTLGIPFPEFNAFLVAGTEFFGGIALFFGILTRLAAIPIGITMIVAILTAHREGGYNYPMLILSSCLLLVAVGGGRFSLDQLFNCCLEKRCGGVK